MNREETKALIEVMQHYVDGGEVEADLGMNHDWMLIDKPSWAVGVNYRKAAKPVTLNYYENTMGDVFPTRKGSSSDNAYAHGGDYTLIKSEEL